MKLIVNADDFGLTDGVTFGILSAMEHGIYRSNPPRMGGSAETCHRLLPVAGIPREHSHEREAHAERDGAACPFRDR